MSHSSKLPYYYIIMIFMIFSLLVCYFVATSKMGYYFRAIKESHDVAEVLGINVVKYRLIAIMVSAFLSAMAGTFYAQYILYIDPESVMLGGHLCPDRPHLHARRRRIGFGPGDRSGYFAAVGRNNPRHAGAQGNRYRYVDLWFFDYDHFRVPASRRLGMDCAHG